MTTLNLIATIFGYVVLAILVFAIAYASVMIFLDRVKEHRRRTNNHNEHSGKFNPLDMAIYDIEQLKRDLHDLQNQVNRMSYSLDDVDDFRIRLEADEEDINIIKSELDDIDAYKYGMEKMEAFLMKKFKEDFKGGEEE